ncbi:MAG TPA: hypothetical protein VE338_02065 [Ktedonobacterales bacterium]|jgi:hypothetical protein|nr:hypothetical protein [Ktedonobacterales bacterium]
MLPGTTGDDHDHHAFSCPAHGHGGPSIRGANILIVFIVFIVFVVFVVVILGVTIGGVAASPGICRGADPAGARPSA